MRGFRKFHNSIVGITLCLGFCTLDGQNVQAASSVRTKRLQNVFLTIPIHVNGAGPFTFLIDTGTSRTVIDERLARDLALEPTGIAVVNTPTGTRQITRSRVNEFSFGGKTLSNVECVRLDLRRDAAVRLDIDGVVGQDILGRFNYLLDYAGNRLEIEETDELERNVEGTRVPAVVKNRKVTLAVKTGSAPEPQLRMVLDSGAQTLVLFGAANRRIRPDIDRAGGGWVTVAAFTGQRPLWEGTLRTLGVGTESFQRLPVVVTDEREGDAFGATDGLLPASLFRSIYVNHRKGYVILNPKKKTE